MKDKLIWCNTKEKLAKVIAKLEKDGYSVPDVDFAWNSYGDEVTLRANEQYKNVTFGSRRWYRENGYGEPDMTADKFLGKNPAIVIFRRDRNVIAKDIATGNEGIAKCSPDDCFVFKTGASIALARLMAKTPDVLTDDVKAEWKKVLGIADTAEPESKFKVGDYVTLKEGVEVDKVYGGLPLLSGSMHDFAYHKRMRVVSVEWQDYVGTYYYECYHEGKFTFHYFEEMLDKWDESKIHEGDTVKVVNTGLSYTTYPQWVGKYISDSYMAARYCSSLLDTSKKYKVIKIAEHEENGRPLAYIEEIDGRCYNSCYLIEVKGLEKA